MKKEEEDEEETYLVKLLCRNCDHQWEQEINKGIYVRYEKDNNYMIKKDESGKKRKYFKCPNCGANKKIARSSIKDFRG